MPNYVYAIIGLLLIFVCTTIGSSFVYFLKNKEISPRLNQIFLGFAAGVMLSASFFSLIEPSLDSEITYMPNWLVVALSIFLGAIFLWGIDKLVPHFHTGSNKDEGLKNKTLSKTTKMFLAVTIHNIPEGLSVGVAFGVALANPSNHSLLMGALLLAIGIGIQNIPEGAVVSLPVKAETTSSNKGFLFGMFSGIVEPIAGVIGLLLALKIEAIMPWSLAFAAGCMIYVIAEEMIPDIKGDSTEHHGVWAFIIGFILMMVLDLL